MEEGLTLPDVSIPLIKGDKGDKGDTGATGATGATGVGISSVEQVDGQLIIHLTNGTDTNVGDIDGVGVSTLVFDEEYNFVLTLTDGTEMTIGNIEDMLGGILSDYYDKDTADSLFSTIDETGNKIDVSINSSTYVMTITLKDKNNTVLSTGTVDLPLESVVVSGSYDSVNKKIVLTLQSGSTIEFSVADLISGLQSEITSSNKLDADLVSDTNTTNKFVTSTEKSIIGTVKTDYAHTLTLGYTASTQELAIGIANYNGTVLDTGIADLTDLARKSYVDDLVGDINTMLDQMNREVI